MYVKIKGGTVEHGQRSLCLTCRKSTIVRGPALRDEIIECGELGSRNSVLRFPVYECNEYLSRAVPTIRDMEDIAWVLRTDSKTRKIGFVQAKDLKVTEKHTLPDEWGD